jgi:uncharacterized protein (DUF2235 family)
MAKRIIFCTDGTWDTPRMNDNVYRLYKALLVTADQVTFYDDGVGADVTGLDHILGGAFGQGLIQKVQDAYTKIAHVFETGDTIYLFGFSRGAYTARSIAGMIATCGLPTGSFTDSCVTQVVQAYRDPPNRAQILNGLGSCQLGQATIQMVGVWDTVGSLGIPAIFGAVDEKTYGFLDTGLHPNIKSAYQALAIDEQRAQFPATLWTSTAAAGQTIEQVWFSGCHSDIGGGTTLAGGVDDSTELSNISLGWIASKAQAQGLVLDPTQSAQFATMPAKYALDAIHESWKPEMGAQHNRAIDPDASVSNSVAVRIQYAQTYTPPNLTLGDDQLLGESYTQVLIVDVNAF